MRRWGDMRWEVKRDEMRKTSQALVVEVEIVVQEVYSSSR